MANQLRRPPLCRHLESSQRHHQYCACNLDPLSHVLLDCSDEAKIHIVPYKSRTSHFNTMTILLGTSYTLEVLLGMKAVSILIFPWSTFVKACLLGCQKLMDGWHQWCHSGTIPKFLDEYGYGLLRDRQHDNCRSHIDMIHGSFWMMAQPFGSDEQWITAVRKPWERFKNCEGNSCTSFGTIQSWTTRP